MARRVLLIPALLLLAALALKFIDPPPLEALRLIVFDTYQRLSPRPYQPATPVRVVEIDDASLQQIGQWPWPRTTMAQLLRQLSTLGASVVAFDIVFSDEDRSSPSRVASDLAAIPGFKNLASQIARLPDNDLLFAQAIAGSPAVLGFALTENGTSHPPTGLVSPLAVGNDSPQQFVARLPAMLANLSVFDAAATGLGSINAVPDRDGVVRRIPLVMSLGARLVPSLTTEILRVHQNSTENPTLRMTPRGATAIKIGDLVVPTDLSGNIWGYFTQAQPQRRISAAAILSGDVDPALIRDHIILIGASATALAHQQATPLDKSGPGVRIHAQAIEQILAGAYLVRPNWASPLELGYTLILGLLLILLLPRLGPLPCAAMGAIAALAALAVSWFSFRQGLLLLDPVGPSLAVLLVYLTSTLLGHMRAESERNAVRTAFGRYVSPELVERLAADRSQLHLGGEQRILSLMFCDIRGFTALSEKLTPTALTSLLNRFFTPMTGIVLHHHGTIDKYIGDCIMAFWNAPVADPDHAVNACRAALGMRAALRVLNTEFAKEGQDPLAFGIGINTGNAMVGNMGSEQRFDYSALGDAVNLAARIEGQSKTYGVDIIISEFTQALAADFAALELDLIRLVGRAQPIRIYALLGDKTEQASADFQALAAAHHAMIAAYRAQNWPRAEACLEACRTHPAAIMVPVYDLYAARIRAFSEYPPSEDWDGSYAATEK
ncbi:MAG: CHASE2 domain-containing protein [Alphaproteobacteria bacterium]